MEDYEQDAENVLNRRKTSSVGDLRMESSVVFPVVNTASFVRIEVPQGRGILHSDSEVQLCLKKTAGSTKTPYYPMLNGIGALIDKAVLRIDDKIVATSDKFNYLTATLNPLISSDDNYSVHQVTKGFQNNWKSSSKQQEVVGGTDSGKVIFDTRRAEKPDQNIRPSDSDTTNPKFSLKLSDLFPGFMKHNALPLFCMPGSSVFVELSFNTDISNNSVAITPVGEVALDSDDISVDTDKTRLFATFLFYDDRVMNAIRSKYNSSGLTFTYHDYSLVEKTLASAGSVTGLQEDEYEIGGAGHVVRYILVHKFNEEGQFYGNYSSQGQIYKGASAVSTISTLGAGAGGNTPGTQTAVATSTTGKGSGCEVSVVVDGVGDVVAIGDITVTSFGAGYKVDEVLTCADLGSGVADVTFVIASVKSVEGTESYQIEVNDQRVFQRDQNQSSALGFHYAQTGDKDLYVPHANYSIESLNSFPDNIQFAGDAYFENAGGRACMRGFSFMTSDENRPGNGVRVGAKNMRLLYKHQGVDVDGATANAPQNFKIWTAYERQFQLKGGEVTVTY